MALHEIPLAHHYFFVPAPDLAKEKMSPDPEDDAVFIGNWEVLNEVAVHMSDDQILGMFGLGNTRCMLFTTMGKKECEERIDMAKQTLKEKGHSLYTNYEKKD